jgi:hypothetical protein
MAVAAATSPDSMAPTVRLTLRIGISIAPARRARAPARAGDQLVVERLVEAVVLRLAVEARRPRPASVRLVEERREVEPRAFQWSIAAAHVEQVGRGRSSRRRCGSRARHDLAHLLGDEEEVVDDVLGLPVKRLRSTGSCVATPTGQVLRWHLRIMMQPIAISGAVAKPNSSAPSSAPMTDVAAGAQPPSTCTRCGRAGRSAPASAGSRQADLPGRAGVLDRGQRRGAGAAVVAGDGDVVGLALATPAATVPTPTSDTSFTETAPRVDVLQVVDQLRQVLDRVDVVVRRRRDQAHARRRVAQLGDVLGRPCGRAAGRPRRAWRPAPS